MARSARSIAASSVSLSSSKPTPISRHRNAAAVFVVDDHRLERRTETLGRVQSLIGIFARQRQNELFPAPAREVRTTGELARQHLTETRQNAINCRMTTLVVDQLEVVHVEQQHRETIRPLLASRELSIHCRDEGAPVA